MKKKLWIIIMVCCVFIGITNVAYAQSTTMSADGLNVDELHEFILENSTVNGSIRRYDTFTISDQEIRLFPETTLSIQDAIEMYPNGYTYIIDKADKLGIISDVDDAQFQSFVKCFAMFESGDSILSAECQGFAIFMDYYENAAINKGILSEASLLVASAEEIDLLMPIQENSKKTIASGEVSVLQEKVNVVSDSAYNATAAVNYAYSWWNKTNNSDYPYYSEYYGMDTSSNAYNDLDEGRSGQSEPKRAWSDCTNFVSQCLVAGGVAQVKSGIILPHQKTSNWYYSDSKPSHTWGGASNFYNHWKDRVGVADSTSQLGLGDVISIDFGSDGSPDHTVIIVSEGTTDSTKTLAAHSTDRYNTYYSDGELYSFSIEYLYSHETWSIYGFVIDLAF